MTENLVSSGSSVMKFLRITSTPRYGTYIFMKVLPYHNEIFRWRGAVVDGVWHCPVLHELWVGFRAIIYQFIEMIDLLPPQRWWNGCRPMFSDGFVIVTYSCPRRQGLRITLVLELLVQFVDLVWFFDKLLQMCIAFGFSNLSPLLRRCLQSAFFDVFNARVFVYFPRGDNIVQEV